MTRAIGQVNDRLLIEYGVTLLDEQGLQIPASSRGWDMLGKTSAHGPRPCLQALARILLSIWNRAHNQGHDFLQAGGDWDNARDLFNRRIKRVFKKVSYSDPYAARADDGGYSVTFAGVRVLAYKITRIDNTTEKTKDSYYELLGFAVIRSGRLRSLRSCTTLAALRVIPMKNAFTWPSQRLSSALVCRTAFIRRNVSEKLRLSLSVFLPSSSTESLQTESS
jgi:hypothetical protein